MNGQYLLNTTLRINAVFTMLSGLGFMFFDEKIVNFLTGDHHPSIFLLGFMLVGFAMFVAAVSVLKNVNKYLVGTIIVSDVLWVLGSFGVVAVHYEQISGTGKIMILLVAALIGIFALFQALGLLRHTDELKTSVDD